MVANNVIVDPLTSAQITRIRRAADEPDAAGTYTDAVIQEIADDSVTPQERYDLNWIIAEIWGEKASSVAKDYAVDSDGSRLERNQRFEQFMAQARHYRSKSVVRSVQILTTEEAREDDDAV